MEVHNQSQIEMAPRGTSSAASAAGPVSQTEGNSAGIAPVQPQRRFSLPSIPSVSEFFTYLSTPKQVTLRAFTLSNTDEFRGNTDEAQAVLQQLKGITVKEGETLVLKRGYLKNYFRSQSSETVSAAEKKSTMNYLFSVATKASPRTPYLDMALLFGTERMKEAPHLSQSYLTKITSASLSGAFQEATPVDSDKSDVTIKLYAAGSVDTTRRMGSDPTVVKKRLLDESFALITPPPNWAARSASMSIQPALNPRNRPKEITPKLKNEITTTVNVSGKSAAIFYIEGQRTYGYKTKTGSGSGFPSYQGLYYVPKEKVSFFLDAVAQSSMSQLDFIATV